MINLNSNSGRKRKRYSQMSEINVTPFVDVMLVLLIVFMVTAPLLTVGIPVDLPKVKASALTDQKDPIEKVLPPYVKKLLIWPLVQSAQVL